MRTELFNLVCNLNAVVKKLDRAIICRERLGCGIRDITITRSCRFYTDDRRLWMTRGDDEIIPIDLADLCVISAGPSLASVLGVEVPTKDRLPTT